MFIYIQVNMFMLGTNTGLAQKKYKLLAARPSLARENILLY